jgi:DNA-binding CsgD family transcriptional regulator
VIPVPAHRAVENGPSRNTGHKGIDELVRQVLRQSGRKLASGPPPHGCDEEILIDTRIDGARYLLIRLPLAKSVLVSLSPREQEIVRMVAKGYPNKTIAGVLNISTWTVCTHLRRVFAKLGVTTRAAMVARLMEEHRAWDKSQPCKNARGITPTDSSRPGSANTLKNLQRSARDGFVDYQPNQNGLSSSKGRSVRTAPTAHKSRGAGAGADQPHLARRRSRALAGP